MKKTVKLIVSFKDDFIPFLKNNQAYKDYVASVLEYQRSGKEDKVTLQDTIYRKFQNLGPCRWASGMFVWSNTNKGLKFWATINSLWYKFLRNEADTDDFEEVGRISKFDVEELFVSESLRGKYYKVRDLSYNRPVTDEWDCKEWNSCKSSVELHETGGTYLVLSEYPEDKVMLWHGGSPCPRPMIKVWVPELDRAQWVFYEKWNLQETE